MQSYVMLLAARHVASKHAKWPCLIVLFSVSFLYPRLLFHIHLVDIQGVSTMTPLRSMK